MKNNRKCDMKFAKKLFIKRFNDGYTAVYIYSQMVEWLHISITADLIDRWVQSDKILSKEDRQNNAISHILSDDFKNMERVNLNQLAFKYEVPIWRLQMLIDLHMTTMEAVNDEK